MNPGGNNELYSQIGPGFAAFVVIFLLALAVWLLARSMNSHLRGVRYAEAEDKALRAERGDDSVPDRAPLDARRDRD